MTDYRIRAGEVRQSKNHGQYEVLWRDGKHAKIKFLKTGYECVAMVTNLGRGAVRDLFYPSVWGVGFLGGAVSKEDSRAHTIWSMMLARCYQEWDDESINRVYNGCSVHEDWHNFQNFKRWYLEQKGNQTFEIDKDLLVYGNTVYSAVTCTLLPHIINTALLDKNRKSVEGFPGVHFKKSNQNYVAQMSTKGCTTKHIGSFATPQEARTAYIQAKKDYLVKLAHEYKNEISQAAYDALLNWNPHDNDLNN